MRYVLFSLTALFLTACGDTDNPVVYTAPAGKAVDDEVKQPPGTNFGVVVKDVGIPPKTAAAQSDQIKTQSEIDRHRTSSVPSPNNGCTLTYFVDADGNLVNELVAGGREVTERVDCPWKEAWDSGEPTLRKSIENQHRYGQLSDAGVLPTVSLSGCLSGGNAVFTFSRNGPTDENLSFTFNVRGGPRITTGFGAGNASYEWNGGAVGPDGVEVWLDPGWHNEDMTGDFILGTSSVTVTNSSSGC